MRKNYLSALLLGALLVTSTGTFTSCKDYDDEINDLQGQITANADNIKALQDKINAGKWITELTSVTGGFKVTFSDGQSFEIVNGKDGAAGEDGEAGKPGTQITIGEDGYWYFDGVKSEYKAVADSETSKTKAPYVNEEDGYWYFYNEAGEAVKSSYKAVGASYAVKTDGGYYLYMPNEVGEMGEPIFIPGAGASITDLELVELKEANADEITIFRTLFELNGYNPNNWKGTKALPADKSVIYSSSKLGLKLNPVSVDGTDVEYVLTTSKNQTLSNVVLKASEYKELVTRASYGNGLYQLSMDNKVLTKDQAATLDKEINDWANAAFSVNADRVVRTNYSVGVNSEKGKELTAIKINNNTFKIGSTGEECPEIKLGTEYKVDGVEASALYDMYFEVAPEVKDAFKITFNQEKHTFIVDRNPDSSTTEAYFDLTVHTAANNGEIKETTIKIALSSEIPSAGEYKEITKNVSESNKTFSFDLATMLNGLQDPETWKLNVNLGATDFKLYKKNTNGTLSEEVSSVFSANNLFKAEFVDANNQPTTTVSKATNVRVTIDNSKAYAAGVYLDNTYYIGVTYINKDGKKLNQSIVPVKFVAPKLSELFAVKEGYVEDGTINAYFYKDNDKTVDLSKYFRVVPEDVKYNLDKESVVVVDNNQKYTTAQVVNEITNDKVELKPTKKVNSQFELGYGAKLIIKAVKDNYEGWRYAANTNDGVYVFNMCLMSPIVEGTVQPIGGKTISISANDLVNGAPITNEDVTGVDYNGNAYGIVPDVVDIDPNTGDAWKNPQITKVEIKQDDDKYINKIEIVGASKSNNKFNYGFFKVYGNSLSQTTEVKLPVQVTDAWGYVLSVPVSVTIQVK